MRLSVLALALCGAATPLLAQAVDRSLPARPDASIRVHALAGRIRITGWDRDTVAVTGTVPPAAGRFFMGGGERGVKLGVDGDGPATPGVLLDIRVPARAIVWVKTATGDIEVSRVTGSLDLYTVSGRVRVEGERVRQVYAESMEGNLEIQAESVTLVRLKTASGAVVVRSAVEDLVVSNVSGVTEVSGSRFGRGRLDTVTGAIAFQGSLDRGGGYLFESHSGPVEIRVPQGTDAEWDVTSIAGTIRNGLTAQRPQASSTTKSSELHIVTGVGGAGVTVRTFRGNVTLQSP